MRILYLTYHPNSLSESYARTEIEWLQERGVDVHLLAKAAHGDESGYRSSVPDVSINEPLPAAVARVEPDIIHVQCFETLVRAHEHDVRAGVGVPVTIRGHSFDFDPGVAARFADIESVRKIWLFPHFAALCAPHPKISGMTACFPDWCYWPGEQKSPRRVVRAMAGLASKNLDEWFEIAKLCPDVNFVLAMVAPVPPLDKYTFEVAGRAPPNVEVAINLQRDDVVELVRSSAISLITLPTTHRLGMPVSLAEAMAAGLAVVAPDVPSARAYLGPSARYFTTPGQAAGHIRELVALDGDEWKQVSDASVSWSGKYRADVVLPEMLAFWESLLR